MGGAAKAAAVSKATIHRAIKSGRLSATRLDDGSYKIDASELARVYPNSAATVSETVSRDEVKPAAETAETGAETLREVVDILKDQLRSERVTSADLRERLDRAEERAFALLTASAHRPAEPVTAVSAPVSAPRAGFLARLLGRR